MGSVSDWLEGGEEGGALVKEDYKDFWIRRLEGGAWRGTQVAGRDVNIMH